MSIMSTARSIKNQSSSLYNSRINSSVGGIDSWWSGKAGSVFQREWSDIDRSAGKASSRIDKLYSRMKAVDDSVDRAKEAARDARLERLV